MATTLYDNIYAQLQIFYLRIQASIHRGGLRELGRDDEPKTPSLEERLLSLQQEPQPGPGNLVGAAELVKVERAKMGRCCSRGNSPIHVDDYKVASPKKQASLA